jgi:NADPH:quinone reductase-like Zn-dependent oxidoreductase
MFPLASFERKVNAWQASFTEVNFSSDHFCLNFILRIADNKEDGGSFAEYLVADAALVISLPDRLAFEEAATIPIGALTACHTLYESLQLTILKAPLKERTPVSFDFRL